MAKDDDEIQDLYVAAYSTPDVAERDWESIKALIKEGSVEVHALALIHRDDDGKIHVKDTRNEPGIGAVAGSIGGALVGLLFPPSLLVSAAVGAGVGAGSGKIVDRVAKRKVRSEVEWNVPAGGAGIAVVFDEEWEDHVNRALANADNVARRHLHDEDDEEKVDHRFD